MLEAKLPKTKRVYKYDKATGKMVEVTRDEKLTLDPELANQAIKLNDEAERDS
jgi:hypothetical protein